MAFDFWSFWRKNGQHITAATVLFFLLFVAYYMYTDLQLKREINANCGWGEDDYQCFCEKSEAMALKNKIDSMLLGELEVFPNVTLD